MPVEKQDNVTDIFEKIRLRCTKDLQAEEASKILVVLSSLYGTLIDVSIDSQMEYNRKYEEFSDKLEKITEARAKAKASPEYEDLLRWEAKVSVCKELINSLKYLLKVKLDEKNESKY